MFAAFLLGLFGSAAHCVGMCSGVALLLGRTKGARGGRVLLLHLGRITTYSVLGLVVGSLGRVLTVAVPREAMTGGQMHGGLALPGFGQVQGAVALLAAAGAVYMAVALLGRAPSPELLLRSATRRWGRAMRRMSATRRATASTPVPARAPVEGLRSLASLYALGLFWGLLPCGLVLTALLVAVASGSSQQGAGTMFLFGLGTWPLTLGLSLAPRIRDVRLRVMPWMRPMTAGVVLLFGVQMALRGLAAWGWVNHFHLGGLALW